MLVKIYFPEKGDQPVAEVNADPANPAAQGGLMGALEYAWARSQNIWGSWSLGQYHYDDVENEDWSPNVKVLAELPRNYRGEICGLRSSMVGDVFEVDGRKFEAAGCGFKELEGGRA